MSRKWKRPTAVKRGGPPGNDRASCKISPENKLAPTGGQLPLIDKYGHRHSESVLVNWSAAAIRALGIRRADF